MQEDGMLTSPWLRALSQFVASLFSVYSSLNPAPVLQYLASELQMGNSTDLELLDQLLTEMGGIRSDIEFNDAQVLAMAGGEHLQTRTMLQLSDRRYAHQKQAQRLIKALADPGLIGPTLVAIAQQRQMYPHHDSSKFVPLKVLGNNLDKIQQVLAQYLDVLKTNLKPADFEAAVPDLVSLVGDFGLEPGIAFTICRFVIVHRIAEYDAVKKQEADGKKRRSSHEHAQTNGDVEMEDGQAKVLTNGDHPMPETAVTPQPSGRESAGELQPWHPVLEPII
jgi:THO complex subunit 2